MSKLRISFVTNSSSSSYVVRYKVDFSNIAEFLQKVKEEFGNNGIKDLFLDVNPSCDSLEFVSGRRVDSDYIFDSLSMLNYGKLFESESSYEEW